MARNGTLLALAKQEKSSISESRGPANPKKVAHVGHSFGSFLTSAFLSFYSSLCDGAIITEYIPNHEAGVIRVAPFDYDYAASNSPARFSDRPSGYVVPGTRTAIQNIFFGGEPGSGFTGEMLTYGEPIKRPITVGEWTSNTAINPGFAASFQDPLQFMEAEDDFPNCGGDCKGTYDLATLKKIYPKATAIEVFIQPNTGHGLTFHQNATAGYQATFDFLNKHEL